ncbi:hypothetical protein [Roseomonas sp. KE2513]|uniref:hypothetical protein n=1 Tax=Roseomonas sp. KE2513 TaxID=2479202 RepID=UPI0018E05301|nr:hypothetical protein [Roseomonas sp. KE2513]
MQLALGLTAATPAGSGDTAGQAKRLPGSSAEDAPTIHDPAQLWFAFVREASR